MDNESRNKPESFPTESDILSSEHGIRGGFGMFRQGMLESDEGFPFFRNPLVLTIMIATVLLLLVSFSTVYFSLFRNTDEVIILHYNVYFGIDIIGSPAQAFVIPGVSFIFFLINTGLAWRFYGSRERVAAHIFLFSAFFASLAGAVVALVLSFINT